MSRHTLSCVLVGRLVSYFLIYQLCNLGEVSSLGLRLCNKKVRQDDISGFFQIINIGFSLSLGTATGQGTEESQSLTRRNKPSFTWGQLSIHMQWARKYFQVGTSTSAFSMHSTLGTSLLPGSGVTEQRAP